jgi:hypothetical protein
VHVAALSVSSHLLTAVAVLVSTSVWLARAKKVINSRALAIAARKRQAIIEHARAEQLLNDSLRQRAAHQIATLSIEERTTIIQLLRSGPKGTICFPPERLLHDDANQIVKVVRPIIEKSGFGIRSLDGMRMWWRPGLSVVVKDRNKPPSNVAKIVRAFREVGIELLIEDDWRLGDDVLLWIGGADPTKDPYARSL